jgi:hypothetical protein
MNSYRIFYPRTTKCTFSPAQGTFSKIGNILGHKESFSKYRRETTEKNIQTYEDGIICF